MPECMHMGCSEVASHILVTYHHEVALGGVFYCQEHAFKQGREECPCCSEYKIHYSVEAGDGTLLPTYPQGTLDEEGCCAEHP